MNNRTIAIVLAILCVIIVLPPIIHGYIYPTGGDDSAHHLNIIRQITLTHPIPAHHLYDGEWMVGYPLIVIQSFLHVPLTASFLWFNYLALIGVVLTSYFVFARLCGRTTGLLAAAVALFLSETIFLFQAGAVFNLINMGIIFPWMVYWGITAWETKSWRRFGIALALLILFTFFHVSGRYIAGLVGVAGILVLVKPYLKTRRAMLLAVLSMLTAILFTVAYALPSISPDAGRQWVDAMSLLWLIGAIGLGWLVEKRQQYSIAALTVVGLIGAYFMLPQWLPDRSAIQPIDKQIIAYMNTLPAKTFYGNENVAFWVYQPYVKEEYNYNLSTGQPVYYDGSEVYIYRSQPMTSGVDTSSPFYFWRKQPILSKNVQPPIATKSIRYFNEGGIVAYVAEASN